jgi:hypothetical protein
MADQVVGGHQAFHPPLHEDILSSEVSCLRGEIQATVA